MFERPDADYLQDLLAGYVLGTLDRVERHYLEEQMARDPKLQQVLYQLEQALEAVEQPSCSHRSPPKVLPAPPRRAPHVRPSERRRAKWIIILSALAAVGAVSLALPWLRQRYEIREFVSEWIPGQAEPDPSLTAWQSLEFLLEDHERVRQSARTETALTETAQAETYATLEQVFAETKEIQALSHQNVSLLRGDRYEQPFFNGLRLTYRSEAPDALATAGTIITVYQLQPEGEQTLWLTGQVLIEAPTGTNLLLWRAKDTVYVIAAQLPFEQLRSQADSLGPI